MKCPTCGTEVPAGQKYCPSCGAQQKTDQPWGTPGTPSPSENREITKAEFYRNHAPDKIRNNIRGSAILCYISAVVTAVVAVLAANPFMFIDVAIILGVGLAIHLKQNRACAVVLLVYGIASCLLTLLQTGRFTGWLIILAGVFAVIYTFRLEKEYRAFRGE